MAVCVEINSLTALPLLWVWVCFSKCRRPLLQSSAGCSAVACGAFATSALEPRWSLELPLRSSLLFATRTTSVTLALTFLVKGRLSQCCSWVNNLFYTAHTSALWNDLERQVVANVYGLVNDRSSFSAQVTGRLRWR